MNIANIPNDKRDAEIHLKARKLAIEELILSLEECGINMSAEALGAMYNDIEEINELLGV